MFRHVVVGPSGIYPCHVVATIVQAVSVAIEHGQRRLVARLERVWQKATAPAPALFDPPCVSPRPPRSPHAMLPAPTVSLDRRRRQFEKYGRRHGFLSSPFFSSRSRLTNLAVCLLALFGALSLLLNLRLLFTSNEETTLSPSTDRFRPWDRLGWRPRPGVNGTAHTPLRHNFQHPGAGQGQRPFAFGGGPHDSVQHVDRPEYAKNLTHLIVVPCHGVWIGSRPELRSDEDEWLLQSFQRNSGRVQSFFSHIARGCAFTCCTRGWD
jgi:hypothetical protein